MLVQDLIRGNLASTVEAQVAETKAHPADEERRHLLLALLAFTGDLDRTLRQIDALSALGPTHLITCATYRGLLQAERERRRVHQDGVHPILPDDAGAYLERRWEGLTALRAGDAAAAESSLAMASSHRMSGRIEGVPFIGIADADEALGDVLEVFAGGHYVWMPFDRIRRI